MTSEGTSIRLPPELFGYGKKLESLGWALVCKDVTKKNRWVKTLNGRLGRVQVKVAYTTPTSEEDGQMTFMAVPSHAMSETHWYGIDDEEDFWEFVHTFDADLLRGGPPPMKPEPRPAPPPPPDPCQCEKHQFTETEAREALHNALVARVIRHNRRRRERRIYECPAKPGVFHLTSIEVWNS